MFKEKQHLFTNTETCLLALLTHRYLTPSPCSSHSGGSLVGDPLVHALSICYYLQ